MTRKKLTDGQVQAIEALDSLKIEINKEVSLVVHPIRFLTAPEELLSVLVLPTCENLPSKRFKTTNEAIAYVEHLLNRQYRWLPHQKGWIMSDEVYTFANGGANKVLELMTLDRTRATWKPWIVSLDSGMEKMIPNMVSTFTFTKKGCTIPADSPIWDAVKWVE